MDRGLGTDLAVVALIVAIQQIEGTSSPRVLAHAVALHELEDLEDALVVAESRLREADSATAWVPQEDAGAALASTVEAQGRLGAHRR